MASEIDFFAPGGDGDLSPALNLWGKGLVYTLRRRPAPPREYRISVGFKRLDRPTAGFLDVYRRVGEIAARRVSEIASKTGVAPRSVILGHHWGRLGNDMTTALVSVGVSGSPKSWTGIKSQPSPTVEQLCSPGGASLDDLARLAPEQADEVWNEFELTDSNGHDSGVVTVSYGEPVAQSGLIDFRPFVLRAERFARYYQGLLRTFGEIADRSFTIRRREWFLASPTFVTVHVCFDR
jgi:hypothetical protein